MLTDSAATPLQIWTSLVVSWTLPDDSNGDAIRAYLVEWATSDFSTGYTRAVQTVTTIVTGGSTVTGYVRFSLDTTAGCPNCAVKEFHRTAFIPVTASQSEMKQALDPGWKTCPMLVT
jgi:hypothetical protein